MLGVRQGRILRFISLFEAAPEQIEGPVGAPLPDGVARARPRGEVEPLRERAVRVREPNEDEPDGLLLRPAVGTGYPGDREPVVCAGSFARTLDHRAGDRLGDGAVLDQELVRNAEQAFLRLVGVGDETFLEVCRGPRNVRQALGEQTSRATLGEGEGRPLSTSRRPTALSRVSSSSPK